MGSNPFCLVTSMAFVLAAAACGSSAPCPEAVNAPADVANPNSKEAIAKVLDDWHDAAAKADEARYFGHLDEASVFLGTDASERWTKAAFLAYAHPHFAKGKAWTFHARRRDIVVDGERIAHFDEDLETAGLGPARGSGVMVLGANGQWRILQYNLAVTIPNERFDVVKEAAGPATVLDSKGDRLGDVALLAGSWIGSSGEETVEEHWTQASAGVMLGSGRNMKGGGVVFFEHLRIEARTDGSVVYVAQPLGKPPTEFRKVAGSSADELVFENLGHDWPKRISYRLAGDKLSVRVEGGPKDRVEAWSMGPAVVRRGRGK